MAIAVGNVLLSECPGPVNSFHSTGVHDSLQQARFDLSFTQRQLLANLNSYYLEANVASSQMSSLKHSLDLSEESLKLTLLRYQAGEVTVLEVVDAQTTLFTARNAYDDGLARYRLSLAALQTLTGAL